MGIDAFQRNQKIFYYHQNEQLSTALVTDRNGDLKNQYQYDAFGIGLDAVEEFPNRIRYTGQQYDQQTEQYYLRARYYNPVLGRFMREDVYQGDGLNLYAYCRNNPVVYYDPSGYAKKNGNTNKAGCYIDDKINGDGNDKEGTERKQKNLNQGQEKKRRTMYLHGQKEIDLTKMRMEKLLQNVCVISNLAWVIIRQKDKLIIVE